MAPVKAIGAIVRLDPEPEKRVAGFERQIAEHSDEGDSLLEEYRAGAWLLGRLHCWTAIERPGGRLERRNGIVVDGVWLGIGDPDGALRHAQEMLTMAIPEIHAELREAGIDIDCAALERMPPDIELAAEVRARL